jgi:type IV pilus biogenesis/stability protein PilW
VHPMRHTLAVAVLVATAAGCGGASGAKKPEPRSPEIQAATKVQTAQAYVRAGRFPEALRLIDEAMALQPSNAGITNYKGQILFFLGRDAEAETLFRRTLELDPYLADAHNNLGALYDRMGRREEAEQEFRKALAERAYPTPEKAHLNLGLLYAAQGRDAEALVELRRAVEINPRYYQGHFELASLLDRQGKLDEAAREYEVAAPDYRTRGDYHYRLGFAYFRLRNYARAQEHLRRAIDVAPGSESAAKADELLKVMP